MKHDRQHKTILVKNENPTKVPVGSVYLGVVSLKGLQIIIFLSQLNKLNLCSTDTRNAYLKEFTSELVYVTARDKFGYLEGCTLIVVKALYS